MDRREFMKTGAAALSLPLMSANPAQALVLQHAAGSGDTALNDVFERIFQEQVRTSPTFATFLGLDKGELAPLRSRLDTRPVATARREEVARTDKFIGWLEAVPEAGLSDSAKLNREVILWDLRTNNVGPKQFDISNPQSPYEVSQQDGSYFSVPDFLHSAHTIDNAADGEAYLSRLAQFATVLDNETAEVRRQAGTGFLAPVWALDLALKQMADLRSPTPEQSTMADSLATRAAAKNVAGDWRSRAAKIVADQVYPALDREIAAVTALRANSRPGDGVWRVPRGDEIYAAALAEATTTKFTADEIHQIGLEQVAEITTELDKILRSAGLTSGTVGERLTEFNKRPDQLYPNTDAGRAQLIDDLNSAVKAMQAKLPQAFATLPNQPLEIRRVPPEIQDGASNGYYRQATLDGSRPAIYFINLKSTEDWPKYSLPALTYHEGVPGHHLQLSIAQKSGELPMLRRIAFYSAYGEGWALYSEQLADELGGYKDVERAGYLQSFLFRAERLIVDTGLNHKRWTREQAIEHMVATTGFARGRVQREIERYCASPGQACSYKIGHIAWLRARQKAQRALGAKFDPREFHEILREGAMPLTILERRIDERVKAKLSAA
jgi:uncharacterized protein (DUF885 family)